MLTPQNKSKPKNGFSNTKETLGKNMLKHTYMFLLGSPSEVEARFLFTFSSSLKISLDG